MECLELKKAIFYPTEIALLRKKGDIIIRINDIEWIEYTKPTFLNYFFASGLFPGSTFPGYLNIHLNKKINKSKSYFVKIKNRDFPKLPKVYRKIIDPTLHCQTDCLN
jgi:hypothetical protein